MVGTLATTTKTGTSVVSTLWKYKFWIILAIVLLPIIITSIKTAIQTNNPTYPFILLGTEIVNSDTLNYNIVQDLQTNPSKVIGMEKPTEGFLNKLKYDWLFFYHVIWAILTNLVFLYLPFKILMGIFLKKDASHKVKAFYNAILVLFILLFIVNLITLVDGLVRGNSLFVLPEGMDSFARAKEIIVFAIPLKGLGFLIWYLVHLIFFNKPNV